MEKAEYSLESAKMNLEKAKKSYEAAKLDSADTLTGYQNKVKSAQLSSNSSSSSFRWKSLRAIWKRPFSPRPSRNGHVGKRRRGRSSSDLMFIIQDTEKLRIVTNVQNTTSARCRWATG